MSSTIRVPGDKSITHRALIFAALADGVSRIERPLDAADTRSTADALRALGCEVGRDHGAFVVTGRGLRGLNASAHSLDCGNSGTTTRLLMGVLAAHPFASELYGDESLQARPMRRVTEPLTRMGARFEELNGDGRLPIRIHGGALRSIAHDNVQSSAQVKSALLLAGLNAGVRVHVTEPRRSRDHTERMLRAMGALIETSHDSAGYAATIHPTSGLTPLDITVPGDFSSAAFFIAAALLSPGEVVLPDVGLNPGRTGMLDVVRRMGGRVDLSNERSVAGEPIGTVRARLSSLAGTSVKAGEVPALIDEIPVLAILAACAAGETHITGAAELRVKETDRIRALALNLQAIGVEVEEQPDGLLIRGTDRPLRGRVQAFGDHRIAMAFGVLGIAASNDIEIDNPAVVDVSFPTFWQDLATFRQDTRRRAQQ